MHNRSFLRAAARPGVLRVPLADPVSFQVVDGDSGLCFEGAFTGAQILRNDETLFRGKTPWVFCVLPHKEIP